LKKRSYGIITWMETLRKNFILLNNKPFCKIME
jgi:hypothetical protein